MFKKILSTLFARVLLAVLTFILAIITSRYLGPGGKGDISLFMLNLTVVQLVNNFVGGGYLVYLIPRKNFMQLLVVSYAWALLSALIIPYALSYLHLLDSEQITPLIIISLLFSIFSINTMVFMGKEEIGSYNLVSLLQAMGTIIGFLFGLEYLKILNITSYIYAMYFSLGFSLIISFVLIVKHFEKISFESLIDTSLEMIQKGFVVQAANTAQLLSYRLSFYILDQFPNGRKEVGIYSIAIAVSEAVWLISQSVSLVLYARISNSNDVHYSQRITIALIKIVFAATFIGIGILLCFPASFYILIFGEGFGEVRYLLFPLSAGVITLSVGIILSAYFVGNGKPKVSAIASSIGLLTTLIVGFILIPEYGMMGAAITASASYITGVMYQFYRFVRETKGLHLRQFVFSRNDIALLTFELKNIFITKKEI